MATVNGEATVKKLDRAGDEVKLQPCNPLYSPIAVTPEDDLQIKGIVVGLLRKYR